MAHYEDIEIDQGTSAKWQILCLDPDGSVRDLSNYRARGSVKRSYEAPDYEALPPPPPPPPPREHPIFVPMPHKLVNGHVVDMSLT